MPFEEYVTKFEKVYLANSSVWFQKAATYYANLAVIESHNANPANTYQMAINQVCGDVCCLLICCSGAELFLQKKQLMTCLLTHVLASSRT